MNKREIILAGMSTSGGEFFTPVQVQKFFFLIDRLLGDKIEGPFFHFQPYDYGPFDVHVYEELESLEQDGLVIITKNPINSMRCYSLTQKGQRKGEGLLEIEPLNHYKDYVLKLSEFIRSLSFKDLITTIYKDFPEMKVNSVFRY